MTAERGLDRRSFLAVCGAAALSGCGAAPRAGEETTTETTDATGTPSPTSTPTETPTATTTASPPSIDDLTWRMHGRDPRNTGVAPTTGPDTSPRKVWDVPVKGIYTLPQPTLVEGVSFVGTGRELYAMGVADGEGRWTTRLDYLAHHYSPAVVDGTVYAPARTMEGVRSGGGEGRLYAVDAASGDVRWGVDGTLSSAPTVVGETVYYTTSTDVGGVHALGTDGTERWSYTFDADGRRTSAYGAPAVAGDTVYVTASAHEDTGATGYLLALSEGEEVWRVELGGEARAAPAVRDGAVHAVTTGGDPAWSTETAGSVFSTPAVDDDRVYALVEGSVAAFDRASGERRWHTTVGDALINGLSVAEDGLYLGGNSVTALGLDGERRWTYPIPGASGGYGAPVALGGTVYVGACIKWDPADPYDDHVFALV